MRIVCSIGLRAGAEMVRQVLLATGGWAGGLAGGLAGARPELALVHVIDTGPRRDLAQLGPARFRPRGGDPRHAQAMDAAEEEAGRAALDEAVAEARAADIEPVIRLERGKPEQVIVAIAREAHASLVAIRARDHAEGHPFVGPASVGHVARFVLDHAPCDVLLLRTQ